MLLLEFSIVFPKIPPSFPLQPFNPTIIRQYPHLLNGHFVQSFKPFILGESVIDKKSVQVFEIGQTDQLRDIGVVPDISCFVWIRIPPHGSGHAEKSHVQDIRFRGINSVNLRFSQFVGDKIFLDDIGMNPIVDFGQIPPDVPTQLLFLFILQPLELLDEIKFKLRGDPRSKLESDVFMGIGAAVSASFGNDPF